MKKSSSNNAMAKTRNISYSDDEIEDDSSSSHKGSSEEDISEDEVTIISEKVSVHKLVNSKDRI